MRSKSLEDLGARRVDTVVGASKHEQKATETPSVIRVVTAHTVKEQGHRTLADILRSVDGFAAANATLFSRELVKGLQVSASVYDRFDPRYRDPVSTDFTQGLIQLDRRAFRVRLTYHF